MRLDGKVAIVTGGGRGIGRGIALAMAAEGARIGILGRGLSTCEDVVREIRATGAEAMALRCDVESRSDVDESIAGVVAAYGRLDVLVDNAQTLLYKSIRKITEQDMDSMWQSGPMGTLRCMQASFEHLRASRGCVINLGSGSSILPQAAMSGYAMAKEAIRVLTRVAAVEWGHFGIRVNAICPLAETPGFDSFLAQTPGSEGMIVSGIPLGRMGDAEVDIGRAAVFLASDDAAYITGTTLMVDGGLTYLR